MKSLKNPILIGIVGILLLVLFGFLLGSFYTVQPGQVGFTKTFGKINNDVKTPGLYFKLPMVTDVITMNTRNIVVTTKETAASKDIQDVTTEVAVNFSIPPKEAITLYETVGTEKDIINNIVEKAIKETIKSSTAEFTATENITERARVSAMMKKSLEEKLLPKRLVINSVDILNLAFSAEFNKSVEDKVKAEQEALREKANLDKIKYQAQQQIESAKAEAEKIRIQAEAITKQGGEEYVKLQWIEAWKSGGAHVPNTIVGQEGANLFLSAGR